MIRLVLAGHISIIEGLTTGSSGRHAFTFCLSAKNAWRAGAKDTEPTYVWLKAWDNVADVCDKLAAKGAKAVVTTKDVIFTPYVGKDGNPRVRIQATVEDIEFLIGMDLKRMEKLETQEKTREQASNGYQPMPEGFMGLDDNFGENE